MKIKNWPAYKNYNRNCRNTTEVNVFLKSLELGGYCDAWYLKNYVRKTEERGTSIQIEFSSEYGPRKSVSVFTRFAAYDKEANGEKVVESAHYEVRVTKYTKVGLETQFPE